MSRRVKLTSDLLVRKGQASPTGASRTPAST